MEIGEFDARAWDERINKDPFIEEPMECVAQVALMRLDSMAGIGPEAKQAAAESILAGARSGVLRVKGMAHPENGKLVSEWRDLDDIGTPLRVDGGPAGGELGLAVPDVYFVQPEAQRLAPWEPGAGNGLGRRNVDFRDHFCVTQMTYDDQGRIASKTDMLDTPIHWQYSHDEAGRLTGAVRNGQTVESYSYDNKGRRRTGRSIWRPGFPLRGQRAYAYAADNRLLEVGDTRCTYDANGALTEKWPGLGEDAPLRLGHENGRIVGMTLPDGKAIEYVYDEDGCRRERKINGETHLEYGWLDLVRLAWVRDVTRGVTVRFTYGMDENGTPLREALFMDVYRDGVSGDGTAAGEHPKPERYGLIVDPLGSLRGVRDEAGQLVKTFEYDSFGNLTFETGGNMFIPIGFAGGLTDPDHGFIHFGYRDPKVGPGTTRTWVAGQP